MTSTSDRTQESADALERYRRRMRRSRSVYFGVVGAVVVALAVVVGVAWQHGEVAHTTLRTASGPQPSLAPASPAANPAQTWRTTDQLAIGVPQWGGTVVTWAGHTVAGRNARTGAQTWTYTRTDRTLCTVAQAGGTTLALYMLHGNCDELSAFDSQTGKRKFTRTLDKDGMPVDGRPRYQVLSYTFMVTTPSVIYAIDPVSGFDRWTYQRQGCTITGAVLGSAGALISQSCSKPVCATQKFCGRGPQLLLRDGVAGGDDNSTTNPDKIKWNRLGNTDVPVAADDVVAALNPSTRAVDVLNSTTGTPLNTVSLSPTPATAQSITAVSAGRTELVWIDGTTYLVDPTRASSEWSRRSGPPTVPDTDAGATASGRSGVTLGTADGVEIVATDTGAVTGTFPLATPGTPATAYAFGSGFLVGARTGSVAYQ